MGTQITTTTDTTALPDLIDRAAHTLSSARSSAEVLEARDMARVAYDAAKSAGRMARAKKAHDDVIAAVYRSQADAAVIEARAKVRLADEYDAEAERRLARKSSWMANARKSFNPGPREPCAVCGKFRSVSQAHHIFPLSMQYRAGLSEPCHDFVWLCPTHHAIVHEIINSSPKNSAAIEDVETVRELPAILLLAVDARLAYETERTKC